MRYNYDLESVRSMPLSSAIRRGHSPARSQFSMNSPSEIDYNRKSGGGYFMASKFIGYWKDAIHP